jgi:hypothetical protein
MKNSNDKQADRVRGIIAMVFVAGTLALAAWVVALVAWVLS